MNYFTYLISKIYNMKEHPNTDLEKPCKLSYHSLEENCPDSQAENSVKAGGARKVGNYSYLVGETALLRPQAV